VIVIFLFHFSERQSSQSGGLAEPHRRKILLDSAKQVGPAIFFSLVIIVVSFLPVFLLEAQEGRMFRSLAWTKTLAVGFSSILAITLVPVLMVLFIRGRLTPESRNPISRINRHQDASGIKDSGAEPGRHPAGWRAGTTNPLGDS
jgi:copper/silver efflux system protein